MTTPDPRDRIILEHAPLVAMPRFTNFPPLENFGHRFIAAEDGLWLELKRPWLDLCWRIAESTMPLPYGPVLEDRIDYAFDADELERITAMFVLDAQQALPNECAAWAVWNEIAGRLEYRPLIAEAASPGSVRFHRPRLELGEHLAIDLHSHGSMMAFFSPTDDEDDRGEVKLAVVAGTLDAEPTFATRLCALGLFIETAGGLEKVCRECGCTDLNPCEGGCTWIEPDLCSRCA